MKLEREGQQIAEVRHLDIYDGVCCFVAIGAVTLTVGPEELLLTDSRGKALRIRLVEVERRARGQAIVTAKLVQPP